MNGTDDKVEAGYGKAWLKAPAKRIAEVLSFALALGFAINSYILHVHAEKDTSDKIDISEIKGNQKLMIETLKELIKVNRESLAEAREQTCLQRLEKTVRDREDICRRAAGKDFR